MEKISNYSNLPTIPDYILISFVGICISLGLFNFWLSKKLNFSLLQTWLIHFIWIAPLNWITSTGFFWNFALPPRFVIMPLLGGLLIFLIFKKTKTTALTNIPIWILVGIQAFRIPLEWWLAELYHLQINSYAMTFHGYNFDIITGITAIPLAWLLIYKPNQTTIRLAKYWNYMGLLFIAIVVTVAILASPMPFRIFTEGPSNSIIFRAPYNLLPGFVVPCAILYHLFCLKIIKNKA